MCGIAGLWDPVAGARERRSNVSTMMNAIRHRGPDGEGFYESNVDPLALGHVRLAIQGLGPGGAQPMVRPGGVLVYNGELFGAAPLREELRARGCEFQGASDTEILLHAILEWGMEKALTKIRGQFAFLFYDTTRRTLCFARDRVGIRPLYFAHHGGRIAFASEQKALLPLPWIAREFRAEAMLRFLAMARTDDVPHETMLRSIDSLPAGHFGEWDGTSLTIKSYFRVDVAPRTTDLEDVRAALRSAMEEQLVGEVPLGALVSGGLDSSTVALLADRARVRRGISEPFHLFAYHDLAAEADEREYQDAVFAAMQSRHEVHWISSSPKEFADLYSLYVHHQEEPYGDVSSYAEFTIARSARKLGVKVLLGGLGGDEVFVGYPTFFGSLTLDLLQRGDLRALNEFRGAIPGIIPMTKHPDQHMAAAALYYLIPTRLRNAISAVRSARESQLPWKQTANTARDAFRKWHVYDHDGHHATNAALRSSIESWCIPRYLLHSDRMALASGVEGRVPLLDDAVIKSAFGTPLEKRVGPQGIKRALREAASAELPPLVRDRKWKQGFHAPLGAYVAGIEEPLREGIAATAQLLDLEAPPWEALPPHLRWRWGALGNYLTWARRYPLATASG